MPNLYGEKCTLLDAVFRQLDRHLDVAALRPQLHDVVSLEPFVDLLLAGDEAAADQDSAVLFTRHNYITIARIMTCIFQPQPQKSMENALTP